MNGLQKSIYVLLFLLLTPAEITVAQNAWDSHILNAELFYNDGEYEASKARLSQAAPLMEQAGANQALAITMQNLAFVTYLEGNLPEAEILYKKALPETEEAFGADSLEYAENMQGIVRILRRQQRFAEAEVLIRKILEIRKRKLGKDHKITGHSLTDLAVNFDRQGKMTEADLAFEEAIQVREKEFGSNSKSLIPHLEQYLKSLKKSQAKIEARISDLNSNGIHEPQSIDPPDAPSDRPRFLKVPGTQSTSLKPFQDDFAQKNGGNGHVGVSSTLPSPDQTANGPGRRINRPAGLN